MSKAFSPPDSRVLIMLVFSLSAMAIAFTDIFWLSGLLLVSLLALAATRISLWRLVRRLRRFRWLFFILAVIQSLTHPGGQVFLQWGETVLVSSHGLLAAVSVMLRITIILAVVLLFTLRDSQQLVVGLVQMKVPYPLAYMVLLEIRFIPVLGEDFTDALLAIQLRGIDMKAIPLGARFRLYTNILLPVVAGALIRARRIATAMDARAFRAYTRRTWLDWPRLTPGDWVLLGGSVAGTAIACVFYYGGMIL